MAIALMIGAMDRGPQDKAETLVLLALADGADGETGETWPSQRRIAERARMTVRGVRNVIQRLAEGGWLTVERRMRPNGAESSSVYRLNVARLDPEGVELRRSRRAKAGEERRSPEAEQRSTGPRNRVPGGEEPRSPHAPERRSDLETTNKKQSARAPASGTLAARNAQDTARRQPERAAASEAAASREAARDVGELDAVQRKLIREGKGVLIAGEMVKPDTASHDQWQAALKSVERWS